MEKTPATIAPQGGTAVAQPSTNFCMSLTELKQRASMVSQIKREVMRPNVHFGAIPGCGDKPTLLKNGAEMLCLAFGLASDIKTEITELGNGHRDYTVTTALMANGVLVATGIGSCSTMEAKYRYRGNELELVGDCPKDYWNKPRPSKYNGHTAKKDESGAWKLYKKGAKSENPDIADTYNTVLKMASKRSLIDATLKATGGSCEFTQDIEDNPEQFRSQGFTEYEEVAPAEESQTKAKPKASANAGSKAAKPSEEEDKANFCRAMGWYVEHFPAYADVMATMGYNGAEDVPANERGKVFTEMRKAYESNKNNAQEADNG